MFKKLYVCGQLLNNTQSILSTNETARTAMGITHSAMPVSTKQAMEGHMHGKHSLVIILVDILRQVSGDGHLFVRHIIANYILNCNCNILVKYW